MPKTSQKTQASDLQSLKTQPAPAAVEGGVPQAASVVSGGDGSPSPEDFLKHQHVEKSQAYFKSYMTSWWLNQPI